MTEGIVFDNLRDDEGYNDLKGLTNIAKVLRDYLTTTKAAERLGISRKRVTQLIHAGRLPAVRLGTDFFIRPNDLKLVADRKPGRPSSTNKTTVRKRKEKT